MFKNVIAVIAVAAVTCVSCKKKTEVIDEYATTDTTGYLKTVADIPVGVGVRYDLMSNDPAYASLVKTHFNSVTFENELKHTNIVSNEGAYDYSRADAAVALAQNAGLSIHGHALVDWQSSNSVYFRSLTSSGAGADVNIVPNPGFENGTGNVFSNWVTQVDPSASGSFEADVISPYQGARAMKVNVATPGQYQYSMQTYSDLFSVTPGAVYTFTFYAKAAVNGSRFKAVIQNTTYQEKTIYVSPSWQQYSFTFTASEPNLTIRLHFPDAGVFYFDNFSILKPVSGENRVDPVKLDNALNQFITNTVSRYKNSIHSWDVVNEALAPGGGLRTGIGETGNNFYFADYLGRSYISNAFRYANQADPTATLFLNETMLESDGAKVDSLVKLINDLKTQGVPVHGIGIQMHLTTKIDRAGIENALSKLASTGLKVRISEMDVRTNPWNIFGYRASNEDLIAQRDLYRFAIGAYYRLVPAAQRSGITFWDPADKYSWIITNQNKEDAPTLFDVGLQKKPAYYGVIVALRKRS
jgi:endo-1,4-beta-xylanase